MSLCKACDKEESLEEDWLCGRCREAFKKFLSKVKDKSGKSWTEPEEGFDSVQHSLSMMSPEQKESYLEVLSEQTRHETMTWVRSSGGKILIKDMNRFHLSGALGIVHEYAEALQEKTGKQYLECVPPEYSALRFYADKKNVPIPDWVDYEIPTEY